MTKEEIFKTNPKLLDEPEVQHLIQYFELTYKKAVNVAKRHLDFHDFVFDKCMYSEVVLKEGTSAKETIEQILTQIGKI